MKEISNVRSVAIQVNCSMDKTNMALICFYPHN